MDTALKLKIKNSKPYDPLRICVPTVKVKETFKICHEGVKAGNRGVAGTLDKLRRTFVIMSTRDKIRRLVERCYACLSKGERGPHVPSLST